MLCSNLLCEPPLATFNQPNQTHPCLGLHDSGSGLASEHGEVHTLASGDSDHWIRPKTLIVPETLPPCEPTSTTFSRPTTVVTTLTLKTHKTVQLYLAANLGHHLVLAPSASQSGTKLTLGWLHHTRQHRSNIKIEIYVWYINVVNFSPFLSYAMFGGAEHCHNCY